MPQLRIVITTPLPDEPLAAFRERHDIEGIVLKMLDSRIAKAESVTPATKKPGRRKPTVKTSSLAWARRNGVWRS